MRVPNEQIVIFVSSLHHVAELGLGFVFSDRHAYLQSAIFYNDIADLEVNLDWMILQNRDFKRDPDDPEKIERYQAEALVHKAVPVEALMGVVCYTQDIENQLNQMVSEHVLTLDVRVLPGWYF